MSSIGLRLVPLDESDYHAISQTTDRFREISCDHLVILVQGISILGTSIVPFSNAIKLQNNLVMSNIACPEGGL